MEVDNTTLIQYLDILDNSFLISQTDLEGNITYANKNFAKISKFTQDELLGKPHNIVRHPDMPKKVFEDLWKTIQAGKIWSGRIKNRAKDGSSYYVKTIVAPIKDDEGNNQYYISFRQDITDLVKTREQLVLEKTLFIKVLDTIPQIVIIRKNHKPFRINKRFFELFGYKNIKDFQKRHKGIQELFEKCEGFFWTDKSDWDTKYSDQELKVCMRDKEGNVRKFATFVSSFKLKKDTYSIITFSDITTIEEEKEKAKLAEHLKSQFLANMSHEIRTPLNSIMGYLHLLEHTHLDSKQKEYIHIMQQSSQMLLDIVNAILDFSKIESKKLELEIEPTNIYNTIIATFLTLLPLAQKKGLDFRLFIADEVAECYVIDSTRLGQVLINLLNNAIKFTKEGSVTLIVENDLTFKVIDTGIGIPPEKKEKIFESYMQATSTKEYGGTGLGLAISSRLVEMMGGKLEVASEVGKGSTFFFTIHPKKCSMHTLAQKIKSVRLLEQDRELEEFFKKFGIVISPKASITISTDPKKNPDIVVEKKANWPYLLYYNLFNFEQSRPQEESSLFYGKILIAEDFEFNRKLLYELLKNYGIQIDFAKDGKEALEKIRTNHYDLILMDITMPKLSGVEVAKKAQTATPIVALTAHALPEEKEEILASMQDILEKPINKQKLERILQKYLKTQKKIPLVQKIAKKFDISYTNSKKFLATFIEETKNALQILEKAIETKDYKTIYEKFHNLKSSAGYLELNHIANIAKEMMYAAKKHESAPYDEAVEKIKNELAKLERLLK